MMTNANSMLKITGSWSPWGNLLCGIGYRGDLREHSFQPFALITLTALAMGTRNAAVRKLAIPDLTTTVLTLAITASARTLRLRNGDNPRLMRRFGAIVAMFLVRHWAQSSYVTRSPRSCGSRPQSPPCAVRVVSPCAHVR